MNQLIPPILIDKDKITRWHPEFDVESVPNINPSPLPKIKIDKSKISTAKDILGKNHKKNIAFLFLVFSGFF